MFYSLFLWNIKTELQHVPTIMSTSPLASAPTFSAIYCPIPVDKLHTFLYITSRFLHWSHFLSPIQISPPAILSFLFCTSLFLSADSFSISMEHFINHPKERKGKKKHLLQHFLSTTIPFLFSSLEPDSLKELSICSFPTSFSLILLKHYQSIFHPYLCIDSFCQVQCWSLHCPT